MNYVIDFTSQQPAYLQLYQQLREAIVKGAYPYQSKIPSRRLLIAETGVSMITVKHSLELLCDEGYIESRQRSGYYVIFKLDDFQDAQPPIAKPSIKTGEVSDGAEFPYSILAKTMRKVILDYNKRLLIKAPNQGCVELREEICSYLKRSRGIYVSREQVVIGSGAEYLYSMIAQLFGKENTFAIENPAYDKIRKVYESLGIECKPLTLRSDGIDSSELWETDALVLHTTPFHSFPTGVTVASSKKHEYLLWAKKREGIIVEDNYDSELTVSTKAEDSLFLMAEGERVIYLNTFSKTIAPSIRIGYMILPEKLVGTFQQRLGFYSCTVPVFDQYVLAELLSSGDFERHINRVRRKKRNEMK